MSMSRPTPDQFTTESAFLDAVAKYVKQVTAENKAYGRKIDRAVDYQHDTMTIHRKAPVKNKPVKTFHDMLNENPVLLTMYKQGRLF